MALNQFDDTLEQLGPQPAIPQAPQSPNPFADTLAGDQAKTSPAGPPAPPKPAPDPFTETLQMEDAAQATRVKQSILTPGAPAAGRAADVLRYATAMHLPADVVDRNFDEISARWKLNQTPIDQLQKDAPATADYMAQGPHQAALVSADLPQLTAIEKLLRAGSSTVRAAGAGFMGFSRGIWGLVQAGAELEGGQLVVPTQFGTFTVSGSFAKGSQEAAGALQEQTRGKYLSTPEEQGGPGMVERAVYGGVEGLGMMAPSMLAGALLGPEALIGSMAAATGGEAYGTARGQGLKPDEAASYGAIQATIAGATAMVPGRWFIKDLAENPAFSKMLLHQVASMVPAQEAQTALADLTAWYALPANTDKPFSAYLKERPSAAAASLIGAIVMGSTTAVGTKLTASMLSDVGAKAKDSATHKTAPDQLGAIVDAATRGMTTETVYLPVKDFTELYQGVGIDPREFAAKITGSAAAYDRSLATGEDLAVPMSKYITEIAATDHNEAVSQIARLHPDEMNAREADAFRKAAAAATEPVTTSADKLRQTVADQLHEAGFERSTAETYAKLYEQAFGTLADRAGLDPLELYKRYGLNINRAALEAPAGKREGTAGKAGEQPTVPFPEGPTTQSGELPPVPAPVEKSGLADIRRELVKLGLIAPDAPSGDELVGRGNADELGGPPSTGPTTKPLPQVPAPPAEAPLEALRAGLIEHGLIPRESFTKSIEGMKRRQADWVQSVSDTFGADGIVRTVNEKAGVEHVIHESTQEPGKFQVTTFRDGVPEGHFNVDSVEAAAKELIGEKLAARATIPGDGEAGTQAAGSNGRGAEPADRAGQGLRDTGREPVARAAGGPVVPGGERQGAGGGRTVAIPNSYVAHFDTLAADARRNGFAGSDDTLAEIFNARLAEARDIVRQLEPDDIEVNQHHDLLKFIADAGGLGIEAEGEGGMRGELEHMLENLSRANRSKAVIKRGKRAGMEQAIPKEFRRSGGLKGIPGIVKRSGGRTADNIFEALNEDGRFGEINSLADMLVKIDDAIRIETGMSSAPEVGGFDLNGILDGALKVREGERWWASVDMLHEAPGDVAAEFGAEGLGDEATSFDIRQFDQSGLFDPPETPGPVVDLLSTGEEQPRLPGDVGAVRDTEAALPALGEVGFGLTGGVNEQGAKQETLFGEPVKAAKPTRVKPRNTEGQTTLFQAAKREPVTQQDLDALTEQLQTTAGPDLQMLMLHAEKNGDIKLDGIAVARGAARAGLGTAVMRELVKFADERGARIVLSLAEKGYQPIEGGAVTTSRDRLREFYKRFGFVDNRGRHKDYALSIYTSMYREPTANGRTLDQPLFHGSPHEFDKFSIDKIGTGEGAASYGHGLYFAENPTVATGYHERLSGESPIEKLKLGTMTIGPFNGFDYSRRASENTVENIRASLAEDLLIDEGALRARAGEAQKLALERLDEKIEDYKLQGYEEGVVAGAKLRKELARPGAVRADFGKVPGAVYQVDIPDAHVANMLDWEKPLTEQPAVVQAAMKKAGIMPEDADALPRGSDLRAAIQSAMNDYAREHGGNESDPVLGKGWNLNVQAQGVGAGGVESIRARARGELADWYKENKARLAPYLAGTGEAAYHKLTVEKGSPKAASEYLKAEGVPGLRYLDQGSRNASNDQTRNVVVFDDSIVTITHKDGTPVTKAERDALFQSSKPGVEGRAPMAQPGPRRGAIRFGPDRQFSIDLLERADLSTFLHETGHFYLEVFGDVVKGLRGKDAAGLNDTQRKLLTDYETVLGHIGATEGVEIPTAAHETFAREFEAYLMDGTAPSDELRSTFARFRAWLLGVYQNVKALAVNLTPEVRAVFDRMLATDAAIADAQKRGAVEPMFATAVDAGMSPEEFKLYSDTVTEASRTAREQLQTKLMTEVQRERQAQWRAERETVRKQLTAEAQAMPEYQAMAAIRRGQNADGTPLVEGMQTEPLKLSKQIIIERYGEDRLARLPKPAIYTVDGGLDPDLVASRFGFGSGDEMLTAIENAPPLKQLVDQATQKHMIAEHGSILLDGSLHEKAEQAVANTRREAVIKSELRALAAKRRQVAPFAEAAGTRARVAAEAERAYERRWLEAEAKLRIAIAEGHKQVEIDKLTKDVADLKAKARGGAATINRAIPPDAVLRQVAEERIGATVIHNLRPEVFWSASRRASREATDAAARQDLDGAITAKQQELLNVHLFRAATDAREDVDARVRQARELVQKPAVRARIGKAGESFLEQIDGILERYDFAPLNQKAAKERATLRKWAAAMEGEGLPVDFSDEQLDDIRRTSFTELTYDELMGVSDALTHLVHLSRLKNRELKAEAGRELSAVVDEVTAGIRAHKAPRAGAQAGRDRSAAAEKVRVVEAYFAQHRKISSLAREIDGGEDNGPMWDHIIRPLNEAGDREAQMFGDAATTFSAAVERAFPGNAKGKLYAREHEPAVGRTMSKMERLMIAMNWGNEGNRQRIRSSEKWTDQQVRAVFSKLDAKDWQFVQDVWDQIDAYWPEIAAKQKRVTGIEPAKVEAAAVETPFGTFRGGYFPLKYDDRLSPQAGAHLDLEGANIQKAAAYVKSTTRRGHTVERLSKVTLPVRYDFGVITEHLNQVIHDLSHHEALVDVQRVLADRGVQKAIYERYGDLTYQQFKDALRDIALGVSPQRQTSFGKALNYLRNGTTISALGFNLTTALFQPLGLSQSVVRIGPKWVAKGVAKWATDAFHMENSAAWIKEQSSFMANRGKTQQREIAEIRNRVVDSTGKVSGWIDATLRGATFNHFTKADLATSYFYLIEKMQQIADIPTWLGQYEKSRAGGLEHERAVALADQAVIDAQSSGQIKDLAAIQRGDPLLKVWTMFYSYMSAQHQLTAESVARTSFKNPKSLGRFAVDMLVLYSVPSTLMYFIKNAVNPVDDKKLGEGLIRENIASLFDSMIGLREFGGIIRGQDYQGPSGARAFVALGRSFKQIGQGEPDAAFWRALNDSAGVLFQYPSTQVWRTLEGIAALSEGKTNNPLVLAQGYKSGAGNK